MIGGKDCEAVTQTPRHDETFKIGSISVKALHTPCHTQDSICWFMEDGADKVVFTGDTLFIGGSAFVSKIDSPELMIVGRLWALFRGHPSRNAHSAE